MNSLSVTEDRVPSVSDTVPMLSVSGLSIDVETDEGRISVVENVSFDIDAGSCLGLVGESGCGKSLTSLAILGLLPHAAGYRISGKIKLEGVDLLSLPEASIRAIRGSVVSMIFQEPMTSLNPSYTVGDQIAEAVLAHERVGARAARSRALDLLRQVRISAPEDRLDEFPHRLSGGMRQRVMIAMALACRPRLIIADEPTTALDVTIQAQILNLLRTLQDETGAAILLISHNLGVMAQLADRVAVMYAGSIVEQAPVQHIFTQPEHPYTMGLLGASPSLSTAIDERLISIGGRVPDLLGRPPGCQFEPRCPFSIPECPRAKPALRPMSAGHDAACFAAPLV